MKIALISLTVIAVMVGAFFIPRIDEHQKAERQRAYCAAIIEILDKYRKASKAQFETRGPAPYTHYVHDISAFDLSKCPKGFQEAWVDYVASFQKLTNDLNAGRRADLSRLLQGGIGLITAESGGGLMVAHAVDGMAKDKAKQAQSNNLDENALIDAAAKLKKIAVHYGVVFHPDN